MPDLSVPAAAPAAFIGIDRSDSRLDLRLQVPGAPPETLALVNTPETVQQWLAALRERFGGQPVAVCFEQPAAALLHQLAGSDFVQLYAINPMTLAKFREAF